MAKGYEDSIQSVATLTKGTSEREAMMRALERQLTNLMGTGVPLYDKGKLVFSYEIRKPSENHPDELRVVSEIEWTGTFRDYLVSKVPVDRVG